MPLFMDYHEELHLPTETIEKFSVEAKANKIDEFGVRQAELFHSADGKVYCLLEAPSAQAVHQHHDALGVDCGEVNEVQGIL
ncbi:MAG TPA: nickel-binding protein [Acidimicrobiales bacterium]|nr:nickel-binding protein [Acidimicrobiales bacterium]